MTGKTHHYRLRTTWTGNLGTGTSSYRDYSRDHEVLIKEGQPALAGSADATFRGDADRYNPEELLVAALSQCHLLSYLHVCAMNSVIVTGYVDRPEGTMITEGIGGHFTEVILKPEVTISAESDPELAVRLHDQAHQACFIANSVNFEVRHEPVVRIGSA